ncbi:M56 family metallopeptidase [Kordia sp. YSTF-M3]|uniref:M56 family metallopeptidase n=1 Tax=Kordia aestuariivivens TaxID=2759037 RepID=A0ABR7Q474_9FLAO|nr:M56 family metallopeptidase [Kordia aestuariivivens]MBC8753201.1 M56 family metallopeptidase [Kordia aestuariivivens]
MITYLIKSGLCLALVLLVYKVLLERERVYVFNRYYLLFGLCFSFIVPFIPMVSSVAIPLVENNSGLIIENTEALPLNMSPQEASNPISWTLYLVGLYAIGGLFFFSRFTSNIYKIFRKIAENTKAFYKKASLVLLKENVVPHTFLHYIFIDKEAHDSSTIANELYTHELAHVSQKHTLDIILIELIQIVFWFNPLLIYYKKAIQLNHEFLADDAVLKSNTQIPAYQQLLLDNASWNHNLYLASNLNFSVTKKRLQMMTKQTSRVRAWLVASLTIPIFMGALFLFSTKVVAKEATAELIETIKTQTIVQQEQEDPKDYYYKNVTFIFEDADGNKVKKKYTELTNKQKENLRQPPKTPVARRPTAKLLNDWKDKKGFAIWLDGKVIDNTEISNHDIVHYTGSRVAKNARSKRFPQLYQMRLYTTAGFEDFKREITNPLGKRAVIHSKEGSYKKPMGKKKVSAKKETKTVQQELAEINKLGINYVNEKSGPNEMEIPTKAEIVMKQNRKDIVVMINKNGDFLVNEDYVCKLNSLDKFVKLELAKILHKKSRTASIRYDNAISKDLVNKAVAILKSNKIYDITIITADSGEEIRLPPPPPVPKKPLVAEKEIEVPAPKKPVVVGKEVKVPASKKPMIKEVEIPDAPTVQETADVARMHRNIKGQKVETMMINGKKHYYVIKNDYKYIYNEKSQLVDKNGKLLPPPPPPPAKKKKKG